MAGPTDGDMLVWDATRGEWVRLQGNFIPFRLPWRSVSADYTIDPATDGGIEVDASGGPITITLIAVAGNEGRTFIVKKIDASANTVTILPVGADTIDGDASEIILFQWTAVVISSNGVAAWRRW